MRPDVKRDMEATIWAFENLVAPYLFETHTDDVMISREEAIAMGYDVPVIQDSCDF